MEIKDTKLDSYFKGVRVHPNAVVDSKAILHDGVSIASGAIVGPNVIIGSGTKIGPNAVIEGQTTIGKDNINPEYKIYIDGKEIIFTLNKYD